MLVEQLEIPNEYVRIFREREAKRIGELMFLYHDTYGLTVDDVKRVTTEYMESESYRKYFNKTLSEAIIIANKMWNDKYVA